MQTSITYKDAGVNVDAGDLLIEQIKPFAKKTLRPEVLTGIGGFGAMFEIAKKYSNPVLVSGTDGVGTKLKLAFELNRHDTIGIDLVAMSVNDILVQGAEPLFFLDYFACGALDVATATSVIKGIADGCAQSNCSLIGGETAEMPGMYHEGEYDLAGFAVGVVEKTQIVDGSKMNTGDVILGLQSSGFHSNGYSLVRKIITHTKVDLNSKFDAGNSFGEALLTPTQIYVKPVLELLKTIEIKAMAHITGGGISGNLTRSFAKGMTAEINLSALPQSILFEWMQSAANLTMAQMLETFNCGIGYAIVLGHNEVTKARAVLNKYNIPSFEIGQVVKHSSSDVIYIE